MEALLDRSEEQERRKRPSWMMAMAFVAFAESIEVCFFSRGAFKA